MVKPGARRTNTTSSTTGANHGKTGTSTNATRSTTHSPKHAAGNPRTTTTAPRKPTPTAKTGTTTVTTPSPTTTHPTRHATGNPHTTTTPRKPTPRSPTPTANTGTTPTTGPATTTTPTSAYTNPVPAATTPNAGIPAAANVEGPTPIDCMQRKSLIDPHAIQSEEWEGLSPLDKKTPMFVMGPFKTTDLVQQYVKTYTGINLVAAGGLYVVSSALHSHLEFQVNALALCLKSATGQGTLGT